MSGVHEVGSGQRGEGCVGREELAHLVLGGPPAQAGEAAHQLDIGEIACRDLVVAALAVVGQALDRPGPYPRDGAQAPQRYMPVSLEWV